MRAKESSHVTEHSHPSRVHTRRGQTSGRSEGPDTATDTAAPSARARTRSKPQRPSTRRAQEGVASMQHGAITQSSETRQLLPFVTSNDAAGDSYTRRRMSDRVGQRHVEHGKSYKPKLFARRNRLTQKPPLG